MHHKLQKESPRCACPICISEEQSVARLRAPVLTGPGFAAGKPTPYLPLFGSWLRDVGFEIGAHVKIDAFEGRIIIDVVAPEYPLKRETHYRQVEEWDDA